MKTDLATGEKTPTNLPSENMVLLQLAENGRVILRPSGTEPKCKFYYTACANTLAEAEARITMLDEAMCKYM